LPDDLKNEIIKNYSYRSVVGYFYKYYKLNHKQIEEAYKKGYHLDSLHCHQQLTQYQINRALKQKKGLSGLLNSKKNSLNSEQIKKAIEVANGNELFMLYTNNDIKGKNIDLAIERREYLGEIYRNSNLSEKQIDKALDLGINTELLYIHQNLSNAQLKRVIFEESYDDYEALNALFDNQNIPETLIDEMIDNAIDSREKVLPLISFSENRNLTDKQVKKIIKKLPEESFSEWLDGVVELRHLSAGNIDTWIERGEQLSHLYTNEIHRFSKKQIEKAIDKGEEDICIATSIISHNLTKDFI